MSQLTDDEIDAIEKMQPFPDENSPLRGMIEWMRRMAVEIKERRSLISLGDVELLQVIRGVLSVDIDDAANTRDKMKDLMPQFSDMCQGSVEDYQNADALLQRLIASTKAS